MDEAEDMDKRREYSEVEQHSNTVVLMHYPPEDDLNITPGTDEYTIWLRIAKARSGKDRGKHEHQR